MNHHVTSYHLLKGIVWQWCSYLCPCEAHGGGRHHEQGPLSPVVGRYADGLHRFPQTHVISQEQTAVFGHGKAATDNTQAAQGHFGSKIQALKKYIFLI